MNFDPTLLGIVNITEDSFSDGGLFLDTDKAIEQALRLREHGAHVIDLGPASSNPKAKTVTAEEEIRRLEPVVNRLQEENIPISIDSFQMETQGYGIEKGVAYLNDIQGFPYPELYETLAAADCKLTLMHSIQRFGKAGREQSDPDTIMDEIFAYFHERVGALEKAGVARDRMILDPGMGFFIGSNTEPSLVVLQNIPALKQEFDLPVLISVSRKSFLRKLAEIPVEEVAPATLSAELFAALRGADYIRTHDVKQLQNGLKVLQALFTYGDGVRVS